MNLLIPFDFVKSGVSLFLYLITRTQKVKLFYLFLERRRQQSSVHSQLIICMILVLGLLFICSKNSYIFLVM